MKEEGKYDPAKIDGEIAKLMSPVRLLDAITDLNGYSIKVFKPEFNLGGYGYSCKNSIPLRCLSLNF